MSGIDTNRKLPNAVRPGPSPESVTGRSGPRPSHMLAICISIRVYIPLGAIIRTKPTTTRTAPNRDTMLSSVRTAHTTPPTRATKAATNNRVKTTTRLWLANGIGILQD
jgi:hypothetical protein